jgi:hypothetical protein
MKSKILDPERCQDMFITCIHYFKEDSIPTLPSEIYSEIRLNRTLNKPKSCVNRILDSHYAGNIC